MKLGCAISLEELATPEELAGSRITDFPLGDDGPDCWIDPREAAQSSEGLVRELAQESVAGWINSPIP
jgi:hypothetical protein